MHAKARREDNVGFYFEKQKNVAEKVGKVLAEK